MVDDDSAFLPWQAGAQLLDQVELDEPLRTARLAVLGTYTTTQLVPMIRLAARRFGIALDAYEAGYDQVEQELLDPGSGLYEFAPDYVLIAAHDGAARLDESVEAEAERWTGLWQLARERSGARVVQHSFAVTPESPLGNLAAQVPGSRPAMLAALNARLAEAAGDDVLLVDCERLAALVGKRTLVRSALLASRPSRPSRWPRCRCSRGRRPRCSPPISGSAGSASCSTSTTRSGAA